jgi:tetratricopeptide (TPR) repeat protein
MYDAFISYSHAKDRPIAAALQSVIQTLGKPWWKLRASHVFRDDTSLSAAPGLGSALESALSASRYLILLASPQSAASKWVEHEIETWLNTKGSETLLIALTEGDLTWDDQSGDFNWGPETPLPQVIRGRLSREPLWVDLRPYQAGGDRIRRSNQSFLAASAALAAPIRGVAREDLLSEEVAQQRRNLRWAQGAATVLAMLTALAIWEAVEATWARNTAQAQRDRAERVLEQVIASANRRVMALADQSRNLIRTEAEISEIASSASPRPDAAGNSVSQLDRAKLLIELSARYLADEDAAASLKAAEAALKSTGAAHGAQEDDANGRLTRSKAYEQIGLASARLGRTDQAASALAMSLELIEKLADQSPYDAELRERTATAHQNSGDISLATKTFEAAERHYKKALELRAKAAGSQSPSIDAKRLLAVTSNRIANLQLAQSNYEGALATNRISISLLEPLAVEAPNDRSLQRELAIAYDLQADALKGTGKPEAALAWVEKDLGITKILNDSSPNYGLSQHDLTTTYTKLGQMLGVLGQGEAALDAYDKAIAVGDALMAQRHPRIGWLRDMAATLEFRGILLTRLGRARDAILSFRRGLAVREQVAATSLDVNWQRELESAYRRTREVLLKSNHPVEALETAEQQLFATSLATDTEPGKNERVARALGSLGWTAIFAHDIPRAVWAGEQAVVLAPNLLFAKLNYAHALMYSEDTSAAKQLYLEGLSGGGTAAAEWRKMIRSDFSDLSAHQLQNPLMVEIDREIGP